MINFFRKRRWRLAQDNQPASPAGRFFKYARYAIGEVVLIMLGIFMALQLQNWNENRKKEEAFKLTLERLFNTMKEDTETYRGLIEGLDDQIERIDFMLNSVDTLNPYFLPYLIQSIFLVENTINTESSFYAENLVFNPENRKQVNLSKQIVTYISGVENFESEIDGRIFDLVRKENIPLPKADPENPNSGWVTSDSTYYSQEQIERARQLLHSEEYRSELLSARTKTIWERSTINVLYSDAQSVIRLIKNYYPDVKLIYEDVGIIGTSIDGFDDVGAISTPMTERSEAPGVWEIELYLKKGRVKFRCRDSWSQNWGGPDFPKGDAISFGPDIPVEEAGQYHVVLDLNNSTYSFNKLSD